MPSAEALAAAQSGNWERWDAEATAWRTARDGAAELPHRSTIQRAFGHHDVGAIRAQVGGDAGRAIGARAYAAGHNVAFATANPDLFTAAHEAAHVVQQRRGASGDTSALERHADDVAALVVSGLSAQSLLDEVSGAGDARIQRKELDAPSPAANAPSDAQIERAGVVLGGVSLSVQLQSGQQLLDETVVEMQTLVRAISPDTIVEGIEVLSPALGYFASVSDEVRAAREIAFDARLLRGLFAHVAKEWHDVRVSAAQLQLMASDASLVVRAFGPALDKLGGELAKLGGVARVHEIVKRASELKAKSSDSTAVKLTEAANATVRHSTAMVGVDDAGKFYAGTGVGIGEGAFQAVRDLVMAPADLADMGKEVVTAILENGLDAITDAARQIGEVIQKLPDVPDAAARMLVQEWKESSDFAKGRSELVFEHGLESRGPNRSLQHHVDANPGRAFRGTTRFKVSPKGYSEKAGALFWAGPDGWIYEIDGIPSWDIGQKLEGRWKWAEGVWGNPPTLGELEQSILAEVPRERIKGAYPVLENEKEGRLHGDFIPNPNYRPR